MHPDELSINALHGLASGETEDEVRIGAEIMADNASDEQSRAFLVRLNDDFHGDGNG